MHFPWYDLALGLIMVGSAIALGMIGTAIVTAHSRHVRDVIRAELRREWQDEWLVGDPLFEPEIVVAVDPAGTEAVIWTKPALSNVWRIAGFA